VLWKYPLHWLGTLAIVAGVIGTALHYLRYGIKHVREESAKEQPTGRGPGGSGSD
jgi:hypothetical protein